MKLLFHLCIEGIVPPCVLENSWGKWPWVGRFGKSWAVLFLFVSKDSVKVSWNCLNQCMPCSLGTRIKDWLVGSIVTLAKKDSQKFEIATSWFFFSNCSKFFYSVNATNFEGNRWCHTMYSFTRHKTPGIKAFLLILETEIIWSSLPCCFCTQFLVSD